MAHKGVVAHRGGWGLVGWVEANIGSWWVIRMGGII